MAVHAYLVTPFTENVAIDIEALIENTRFLKERVPQLWYPLGELRNLIL